MSVLALWTEPGAPVVGLADVPQAVASKEPEGQAREFGSCVIRGSSPTFLSVVVAESRDDDGCRVPCEGAEPRDAAFTQAKEAEE